MNMNSQIDSLDGNDDDDNDEVKDGETSNSSATEGDDAPEADEDGGSKSDESGEEDLFQFIHDDNAAVAELFFQFSQAEEDDAKEKLFKQIKAGLTVHAQLAEEILYPLVVESAEEDDREEAEELVAEAKAGNHIASMVLNEIAATDADDDSFEAMMSILCELVKKQVKREEKEMFDKLRAVGIHLDGLGTEASDRKAELTSKALKSKSRAGKKSRGSAAAKAKSKAKAKAPSKGKKPSKPKTVSKKSAGGKSAAAGKAKKAVKAKTSSKAPKATKVSIKKTVKKAGSVKPAAKKAVGKKAVEKKVVSKKTVKNTQATKIGSKSTKKDSSPKRPAAKSKTKTGVKVSSKKRGR